MADELIKAENGLPAVPQMSIFATQGGTAIGQVFGDIHIDATEEMVKQIVAKMIGPQTESHAAEWALLNTEKFNVLFWKMRNTTADVSLFQNDAP